MQECPEAPSLSDLVKLSVCVQLGSVSCACVREHLRPCGCSLELRHGGEKAEQMPFHWAASGHQIGNITDQVPIQLQATNWCITESVCVRLTGCVLDFMCVSESCECYVCAGMRSCCLSIPGLRGKKDDPAQLTLSHAGQYNTITLLLTRTWHTSHLLPPEPHTGQGQAWTWIHIYNNSLRHNRLIFIWASSFFI